MRQSEPVVSALLLVPRSRAGLETARAADDYLWQHAFLGGWWLSRPLGAVDLRPRFERLDGSSLARATDRLTSSSAESGPGRIEGVDELCV
jgi:hypothetical protein